eukprot:TRINITY_DN14367_c0_g1_i1.p1 TRINITY_DN14367_c0_g1~~TRINITY_DN14367_c0_g1_i1.p1  ORF type:complete len:1042 (+),score=113.04 TRINITY_DN14367_c0_g1_i1:26-3151(+)
MDRSDSEDDIVELGQVEVENTSFISCDVPHTEDVGGLNVSPGSGHGPRSVLRQRGNSMASRGRMNSHMRKIDSRADSIGLESTVLGKVGSFVGKQDTAAYDDVNEILEKIAGLGAQSRQTLKHHIAMYEMHDYNKLSCDTPISEHKSEFTPVDEWKSHIRSKFGSKGKHSNVVIDKKFQSLNYSGHDDHVVSRTHVAATAMKDKTAIKMTQWALYILIGILTGITAFGVKRGEEFFGHWKHLQVDKKVASGDFDVAFAYMWGCSMAFTTVAVWITFLEPAAAGSGVPDVKSVLNGVKIPGMLCLRAFIAKVVGVIFGVASGLAMGPEGPMIHAGAILAGGISQGFTRWPFRWAAPFMKPFRNDSSKRDAVSAGAAAGVAAAFGAPIGGVLFSLEEASSYWSGSHTWRVMITCGFATFTMTILVYGGDRFNDPGLVHFGVAEGIPSRYRVWEYLAWIPMAILSGLLGGLFNAVTIRKIATVNKIRQWFVNWSSPCISRKKSFFIIVTLEAWIVITVICLGNFYIAEMGECLKTPYIDLPDSLRPVDPMNACIEEGHNLHFLPHKCEAVALDLDIESTYNYRYNDMGTLSLLPQLEAIRVLLSRDLLPSPFDTYDDNGRPVINGTGVLSPKIFGYSSLCFYFPMYFFFTVITAGLFMPQGLFVPHIVIGALGGRLYGTFIYDNISTDAQPGTYALMGAAGMLAGSTRITISLAVIIFEITNDIQYLVPIILVIVISKYIASFINEPYYDELLELRNIPVLEEEPPHNMELLHVGDIMTPHPQCCDRILSLLELTTLLQTSSHNAFPVIRGGQDRTLLGSISTEAISVLVVAYNETVSAQAPGGCIGYLKGDVPPPPLTFARFREIEDRLRVEGTGPGGVQLGVSACAGELENVYVDLLPYVCLSTNIVTPTFSLKQAFLMFRSLGLRHLVVVNTAHAPIGIITRRELQKHFLHVWLQRENDRATNALTVESLNRLPRKHRSSSVHEVVEEELGEDFGSTILQPGDLFWDKQIGSASPSKEADADAKEVRFRVKPTDQPPEDSA